MHIIVRGVDLEGDDVRIDRSYMAHGMRWRAQEILTRELGRRSEMDVSAALAADLGRDAFTETDRAIAEYSSPDGSVRLSKLLAAPVGEGRACLDRLQVLEEMQLARKDSDGVWHLAEGWKECLIQRGEDLDVRRRLRALLGDEASRYRVIRREDPLPVADGVVVAKGLHDELTGEFFAAIKTGDAKGYYIRMPPAVAEAVQEGDAVRVGFEVEPWLKPADRIVARFAQENGGTYDPVRHQHALEGLRQASTGDRAPSPAERVVANVRRLERLARYRLATRLSDGRWQIPADLLNQLEARERTHPQHRLRFEKLGSSTQEPVRSPAQEVASERETLGRALSKELGLVYISKPPALTGRVSACAPTPSGREYLRIVDHRARQFTLIRKPVGAEGLDGRTVHLTRARDGRLSLQIDRGIAR